MTRHLNYISFLLFHVGTEEIIISESNLFLHETTGRENISALPLFPISFLQTFRKHLKYVKSTFKMFEETV